MAGFSKGVLHGGLIGAVGLVALSLSQPRPEWRAPDSVVVPAASAQGDVPEAQAEAGPRSASGGDGQDAADVPTLSSEEPNQAEAEQPVQALTDAPDREPSDGVDSKQSAKDAEQGAEPAPDPLGQASAEMSADPDQDTAAMPDVAVSDDAASGDAVEAGQANRPASPAAEALDLPVGSEFARPSDLAPTAPAALTTGQGGQHAEPPSVIAPAAEPAPAPATQSAAAPGPSLAPAAPVAISDQPVPVDLPTRPRDEAPIPVPPPGRVQIPALDRQPEAAPRAVPAPAAAMRPLAPAQARPAMPAPVATSRPAAPRLGQPSSQRESVPPPPDAAPQPAASAPSLTTAPQPTPTASPSAPSPSAPAVGTSDSPALPAPLRGEAGDAAPAADATVDVAPLQGNGAGPALPPEDLADAAVSVRLQRDGVVPRAAAEQGPAARPSAPQSDNVTLPALPNVPPVQVLPDAVAAPDSDALPAPVTGQAPAALAARVSPNGPAAPAIGAAEPDASAMVISQPSAGAADGAAQSAEDRGPFPSTPAVQSPRAVEDTRTEIAPSANPSLPASPPLDQERLPVADRDMPPPDAPNPGFAAPDLRLPGLFTTTP